MAFRYFAGLNHSQKGQSLIELVVVMSVLIVLALIALPQLRSSRDLLRFTGLQREIVTYLRNARQQAITQRTAITFRYDDTAKRIVLYGGNYGAVGNARNIKTRLTGGGLRDYQIVYGRPTGATTSPLADATNLTPLSMGVVEVTFQADGSVLDGSGNPQARGLFFYNADKADDTAFAVTILGFGGRIKTWKFNRAANAYQE